jgi:hypothetical protein
VKEAGLALRAVGPALRTDMDLEQWLESTGTEAAAREEVRRALGAEVAGGLATGMGAHRDSAGRLCFTHVYTVVVGDKGE